MLRSSLEDYPFSALATSAECNEPSDAHQTTDSACRSARFNFGVCVETNLSPSFTVRTVEKLFWRGRKKAAQQLESGNLYRAKDLIFTAPIMPISPSESRRKVEGSGTDSLSTSSL